MAVQTAERLPSNPVYTGYFADPFVWKVEQTYYAIGTGESEACGRTRGRIFPVLRSDDFCEWQFVGKALLPTAKELGTNFWAPEVRETAGVFYLYYSVGHGDKRHQLRVAAAGKPEGPYEDVGKPLLPLEACGFAIDPHPFQDHDGRWYLFYARDFLECAPEERPGTALVAALMPSPSELGNAETVVLRAHWDWQRFAAERAMYGGTWDWHTLEGPCVRRHEGRYYCFYSGGRWENDTYGVDYAVANQVLGPYSDQGAGDGPRVLRTVPGKVLGPGHNSIVKGPDGSTDYIAYHAWDKAMSARRMFLDRLLWTRSGPRCEGPTWGDHSIAA
jgi:beta-xylosidase